uniref:Pentacotripeptide-repeat region of PRORP domain-containing protein n=1 Tax=Odontella aurita TaxID=265563 RepID=A0A7S4J5N3_9STRA|mmetsp:Transcript_3911/g.10781  ORF Transcript_3911/g.10781 Transcript_3911/m.10781 type:complete len:637 (+) Transcript_3911:322-2232(+)
MNSKTSPSDDFKVDPNAVVYSTVISACERSVPPKPDDALRLLREATEDPSIEMGVVGYNAALSALARAGEWRKAVRLLDEMEGGCDSPHCSLLHVDEEGDNGAPRGAKSSSPFPPLLDPDVVKPRPDEVTYGTVMAACERSEEWGMVLRYAEALNDRAADDPAFALDGVTITSALHACQRLGRCDEALEYLEMMKELDKTGDAESSYDADAGGQRTTRGRDRKGARAPLRGPDAVAYRLAISACARSRGGERWADGLRLLQEMRERTGAPPDVVAYTAAIGGCAEAGQCELAFQLLEKMGEDGVQPNRVTYNAAIRACATASARAAAEYGDSNAAGADPAVREPMERALALLTQMKSGEKGKDAEPDIVTYNAAIRACAEAMSIKGALDLMDDLRSRGLVPTVVTYGSLMTACERVGSVTCASKVFSMLREQQRTDDTLEANEIVYGAAISCCRKAGQRERTLLLLRKIISEGLSPNAATFNTVLTAQVEGKTPDLDRAASVYKLMGSRHAPGAKPNRQTYTLLVRGFASNFRPNDAEIFLRRMRGDGYAPDVDLYTATVTSYERTKQPIKALRLMESMREDGYNFYDIQVLDQAFKKAIKLVNVVGQGLSTSSGDEEGGVDDGDFDVDVLSGNTI